MSTGLTYEKQDYSFKTKTVELRIPKDWGMFTSAGNRSLRQKAEKLVEQCKTTDSLIERLKFFRDYFKGYRSLIGTKTMGEAGDTAVREQVWCFAMDLGKCLRIDSKTLDDLWDSKDSYPAPKKPKPTSNSGQYITKRQ